MKQIAFVSDWELFGVDELATTAPRRAVLSVLLDENDNAALFCTKKEGEATGYYQLPGGEIGTSDAAMACPRIIRSRAGRPCVVEANLGVIIENRSLYGFTQINYCFVTRVAGDQWRPDLSDAEKTSGTQLAWLPLPEIIALLGGERENYDEKYVHYRDLALAKEVVNYLMHEKSAE